MNTLIILATATVVAATTLAVFWLASRVHAKAANAKTRIKISPKGGFEIQLTSSTSKSK